MDERYKESENADTTSHLKKEIGITIYTLRHKHFNRIVGQKELALFLGINQSALSKIENGNVSLGILRLTQIALFFKIEPSHILKSAEIRKSRSLPPGLSFEDRWIAIFGKPMHTGNQNEKD